MSARTRSRDGWSSRARRAQLHPQPVRRAQNPSALKVSSIYQTGPTGAYLRRPTYLASQRPHGVRCRVICATARGCVPRERAYPGGTSEFLVAATLDSAMALMRSTVSFTP